MLNRLNQLNNFSIFDVECESFSKYGKIVEGYDFTIFDEYMNTNTEIPEDGNLYVAQEKKLEENELYNQVRDNIYGGMPIQIGYCNGKNRTINGFEFHKGSEIVYALTDFVLCLGNVSEIQNDEFNVENARFYYIKKGCAVELYQTTLHLSPIRIDDAGYRSVIILPLGTNTSLELKEKKDRLLLMKNKWVIAHPTRHQLVSIGAHPGVVGENKQLNY